MAAGNSLVYQKIVSFKNHFRVSAKVAQGIRINRMILDIICNPTVKLPSLFSAYTINVALGIIYLFVVAIGCKPNPV